MSYTETDYKTKKELKEALRAKALIRIYNPGLGVAPTDGVAFLEGPHYQNKQGVVCSHTWYASVQMKDGNVEEVLK